MNSSYERALEYARRAKSKARTRQGTIKAAVEWYRHYVVRIKTACRVDHVGYVTDGFDEIKYVYGIEYAEAKAAGLRCVLLRHTFNRSGKRRSFSTEERKRRETLGRLAKLTPGRKAAATRKLRDEWRKLYIPEMTFEAITEFCATSAAVEREQKSDTIAEQLQALGHARPSIPRLPIATLPVSRKSDRLASSEINLDVCTRGKNWDVEPTFSKSHVSHSEGYTEWKKGKPKAYTRAKNTTYVRSFAILRDLTHVDFILHNTKFSLAAPTGYWWQIDDNGLKLENSVGDYHVVAYDLLSCVRSPDTGFDRLKKIIADNAQIRADNKIVESIFKNPTESLKDVYVCLRDSLKGGNCETGSRAWCNRAQLDPNRHYPAIGLLKISTEDRVRKAIVYAYRRTRREMEQGYALLEEHRL